MRTNLLSKRLRDLRRSVGLSQEALGAQGFVSTPGWVKIENGTRQPSDTLLEKLVNWAQNDGYVTKDERDNLLQELLSLKYMTHLSPFVSRLAKNYYETVNRPNVLLAPKVTREYGAKKQLATVEV
jgi:transcriptional regulator with XRE-family HTH domain